MTGIIRFPHLGIILENVPRWFQVGGLEIACYGIVLAAAMMTGIFLVMEVAKRTGQNGDAYFDLGIIAIAVSVLCARIYYVVFSWDYYSKHLLEIFNLRRGGLAIYGGVAGGIVTAILFCQRRKLDRRTVLDIAVIGLIWGQMIGRWGNFFNREAFGGYTDVLFAMQLPVEDVRASEITDIMRAHIQEIDGVSYIQVHPTFLYESLWNLGVLLILLAITFWVKNRFEGMVFLFYLLLYGSGRFWIEGLRTDQLLVPGTEIPVSQLLSGILVLVSAVILVIKKKRGTKEYDKKRTDQRPD